VVKAVIGDVFVSRAERRRARGEGHAATIKQIREVDGKDVVFERKAVEKLTLADLDNIPVPAPYGKVAEPVKLRDAMVAELRRWIEYQKPKDALPEFPKGHVIRKVRVASKDKVAVSVRGGTADRGDMARVDVFAKANRRGKEEFYLVPVYPHQVADRVEFPKPPSRSVVAYEAEEKWTAIDSSFRFRFSLYANSFVEVAKSDGEIIRGYFKGVHRGTGAITVSPHENPRRLRGGIGAKTLTYFRKFEVDRLGCLNEVLAEVRTWHGEACT
jgi:CRISPR-associated endonuclease Csn1